MAASSHLPAAPASAAGHTLLFSAFVCTKLWGIGDRQSLGLPLMAHYNSPRVRATSQGDISNRGTMGRQRKEHGIGRRGSPILALAAALAGWVH